MATGQKCSRPLVSWLSWLAKCQGPLSPATSRYRTSHTSTVWLLLTPQAIVYFQTNTAGSRFLARLLRTTSNSTANSRHTLVYAFIIPEMPRVAQGPRGSSSRVPSGSMAASPFKSPVKYVIKMMKFDFSLAKSTIWNLLQCDRLWRMAGTSKQGNLY